jgi:hypothetical protein
VPGANELAVLDQAFAERATTVQANVIHGAVGAVHVGEQISLPAQGNSLASLGPGRFDSLVSLTTVDIGSLGGSMLPSFARLDSRGRLSLHTKLLTRNYFG